MVCLSSPARYYIHMGPLIPLVLIKVVQTLNVVVSNKQICSLKMDGNSTSMNMLI